MTIPQTTLTLTCPRCIGIGHSLEDRNGEHCTICRGTGNAALNIVSTNAALNFLLGKVVEIDRYLNDGDPGVYQKYFDELSAFNKGDNE